MFFTANKAIIIPAIAAFTIFFTVLYTSCIKNKCNGIVCLHEGVCVEANCTCITGYEGARCEKAWYEKFAGQWNADDSYIRDTSNTHFKYDISISGNLGNAPDTFTLSGLSDSFKNIVCYRTSLNEFIIKPDQKLDSTITIKNGNGTLNPQSQIISGLYTYRFRGYMNKLVSLATSVDPIPGLAAKNDSMYMPVKKDTTITINFKWIR